MIPRDRKVPKVYYFLEKKEILQEKTVITRWNLCATAQKFQLKGSTCNSGLREFRLTQTVFCQIILLELLFTWEDQRNISHWNACTILILSLNNEIFWEGLNEALTIKILNKILCFSSHYCRGLVMCLSWRA